MTTATMIVLAVAVAAVLAFCLLRGKAIERTEHKGSEFHPGRDLLDESAAAVENVYGPFLKGDPHNRI